MVNSELSEIRNSLTGFLEQNNYQWIIEQWTEEISKGKFSAKSVKELKGDSAAYYTIAKSNYTPKENIVFSEPYTLKEEVELLISSIEIGLIKLYETAKTTLASMGSDVNEIIFQDENNNAKVFSVNANALIGIEPNYVRLKILLNELKTELSNAN